MPTDPRTGDTGSATPSGPEGPAGVNASGPAGSGAVGPPEGTSGPELARAVLDDVFAELDAGRRDRLAALVRDAAQLIVTCAVPEDVPSALRGARYDVGLGTVSRAE